MQAKRQESTKSSNASSSWWNSGGRGVVFYPAVNAGDLNHAIAMVKKYDPAGYLPGLLLPNAKMQASYYAVRSFWIETGLRHDTTAKVPAHSSPAEHLAWWQQGIQRIFGADRSLTMDDSDAETSKNDWNHPTLRLLSDLLYDNGASTHWTRQHFDDVLQGRRADLNVTQYERTADLIWHAKMTCASLLQLVLESGHMTTSTNPSAHEAARYVGIAHGITNMLRLSIPIVSTTGRLVIPASLTQKYGARSPRYLLSALGQNDEVCLQALRHATRDIAIRARQYLQEARNLKEHVRHEPSGSSAVAVLLPGLAAETFLNRLEEAKFELTNRDLRNVGSTEHAKCAANMIVAYYRQRY